MVSVIDAYDGDHEAASPKAGAATIPSPLCSGNILCDENISPSKRRSYTERGSAHATVRVVARPQTEVMIYCE